nr:ABC transporter ATP-binding protein [Burkholderiaceae bacterium]
MPYRFFENRIPPYPPGEPVPPPKGFTAFVWACTQGTRGYVAALALLSAAIAAYEAFLFAALGKLVDWLVQVPAGELWAQRGGMLGVLAAVLLGSTVIVALQTIVKHQALAINFPMRLRWNFHRLMLGQSMSFYADEFAGRITTKVMQTALGVRDMIFTSTDVLVGIGVYFITIVVLAGGFDLRLVIPFVAWAVLYGLSVAYFVPRLGKVSRAQADARSMMTGRITDAYTNISTVKLFSHTHREASFARAAMQDFTQTGYKQMRLVSSFEIVNHALVVALILSSGGAALWLWQQQLVGIGAVAAVTAMALRISGMSHWIMWEMTS